MADEEEAIELPVTYSHRSIPFGRVPPSSYTPVFWLSAWNFHPGAAATGAVTRAPSRTRRNSNRIKGGFLNGVPLVLRSELPGITCIGAMKIQISGHREDFAPAASDQNLYTFKISLLAQIRDPCPYNFQLRRSNENNDQYFSKFPPSNRAFSILSPLKIK